MLLRQTNISLKFDMSYMKGHDNKCVLSRAEEALRTVEITARMCCQMN